MAKSMQYICDACGKIVGGKVGTVEAKHNHIKIQGRITSEYWDHEVEKRCYFHASPTSQAEVILCDGKCLDTYIEQRKILYRNHQVSRLREEASNQF